MLCVVRSKVAWFICPFNLGREGTDRFFWVQSAKARAMSTRSTPRDEEQSLAVFAIGGCLYSNENLRYSALSYRTS